MRGYDAELYVVTKDASRHAMVFDYAGVATAIDEERWWEGTIRSAWEAAINCSDLGGPVKQGATSFKR
jgi:hypothetical protein